MAERRRPAIIWDMGGVLYRYFTEVLLDLAGERTWEVSGVPLGPTGDRPDEAYAQMDRGDIDEATYVRIVRERFAVVGVELDPVAEVVWDDELRPVVWEAVRRAHEAGHAQAVLTNDAAAWLGAGWWETWEPAAWFEAVLDVSTLPGRKPEPGPYRAAARALGVRSSACLFVDDLAVNCRGAERVGMDSHRFDVTDPDASTQTLLQRLGLAGPVSPVGT